MSTTLVPQDTSTLTYSDENELRDRQGGGWGNALPLATATTVLAFEGAPDERVGATQRAHHAILGGECHICSYR